MKGRTQFLNEMSNKPSTFEVSHFIEETTIGDENKTQQGGIQLNNRALVGRLGGCTQQTHLMKHIHQNFLFVLQVIHHI